ncbi:hypothetical protein ACIRS1_35010 [Kitasatospora sp. NPDC101176]|uniref:hypothetical protein n=1 Tax=Kitasatospora sp. NPDC101176 TaxID=3364099 RepID=UPI00380033EF
MTRLRAAAAALVISATALLPTAGTAHASTRAEIQVNSFFGKYREAVLDQPSQDPQEVRKEFLAPELEPVLDQWASDHDANPIFRAQNVPDSWSIALGDSDAGHTTVLLTENWTDGTHTVVQYQVRTDNLVIDDLKDAPQTQ